MPEWRIFEPLTGIADRASRERSLGMPGLTKPLTAMGQLDLTGTRVGNAGLRHLSEMTELMESNLTGTRVTDAGIKELASHAKLEILNGGHEIGDTGVVALAPRGLRDLNLSGTDVQPTGGICRIS